LLETALEAEVTAFLAGTATNAALMRGPGHRKGHQPVTVKTTSGPVTLQRPKLRGTTQRFASTLLGAHVTWTNALEALVIAGFVRGLRTRDVKRVWSRHRSSGRREPLDGQRICSQIRHRVRRLVDPQPGRHRPG
jgi:putative transposase